jgi:hypothetical protein
MGLLNSRAQGVLKYAVGSNRELVADYADFKTQPDSARRAPNCIITAYHVHEWVWGHWLKTEIYSTLFARTIGDVLQRERTAARMDETPARLATASREHPARTARQMRAATAREYLEVASRAVFARGFAPASPVPLALAVRCALARCAVARFAQAGGQFLRGPAFCEQ